MRDGVNTNRNREGQKCNENDNKADTYTVVLGFGCYGIESESWTMAS